MRPNERLHCVWHNKSRVHLCQRELSRVCGEDGGVLQCTTGQPDDSAQAPWDPEDGERGQIVSRDGGIDFGREGLLPKRRVHDDQSEISKLEVETPNDGVLGLHGQEGALVIARDVVLAGRCHDFLPETGKSTHGVMGQYGQGEVNDEDQGHEGVEEISEESRFETTHCRVKHNYLGYQLRCQPMHKVSFWGWLTSEGYQNTCSHKVYA